MSTNEQNSSTSLETVLLFHKHLTTRTSSPLLPALQNLINEAYFHLENRKDLFTFIERRLSQPSGLVDEVGPNGFTIIIFSKDGLSQAGNCDTIVATGSAKPSVGGLGKFLDDITEEITQRRNKTGVEHNTNTSHETTTQKTEYVHSVEKLRSEFQEEEFGDLSMATASTEVKVGADVVSSSSTASFLSPNYELTLFAVSLSHNKLGLGALVLRELEWLLSMPPRVLSFLASSNPPLASYSSITFGNAIGINMAQLRSTILSNSLWLLAAPEGMTSRADGALLGEQKPESARKIVVICVSETGNEQYFARRGFIQKEKVKIPVGLWYSTGKGTLVYMEKEIKPIE